MLSLREASLRDKYFYKAFQKILLALPLFTAHFDAKAKGVLSTVKSLKKFPASVIS